MLDYGDSYDQDLAHFRQIQNDYDLWHHLAADLYAAGDNQKLYRLLVGNRAW
jgi:hypothetical protein